VPAWHVSVCVHALLSLHAVPLALFGLEQAPVPGSHTPATWHWSSALHVTGLAPVQVPAWQVSVCVHALSSSQAGPVNSAQVPSVAAPAATEHASQGPASHAVLQQTPSAQKPLGQSLGSEHAEPREVYSSALAR